MPPVVGYAIALTRQQGGDPADDPVKSTSRAGNARAEATDIVDQIRADDEAQLETQILAARSALDDAEALKQITPQPLVERTPSHSRPSPGDTDELESLTRADLPGRR